MKTEKFHSAVLSVKYGLIIFVFSIIMLMLLFAVTSVFMRNIVVGEKEISRYEVIDSINQIITTDFETLLNKESLTNKEQEDAVKSTLRHVLFIENRQENVLNDLRQESNNIINKVNGWLGFWIAILAIFTGLLPIIIQYVVFKRQKLNVDLLISEIQKKAYTNHLQLLASSVCLQYELGIVSDNSKKSALINLIISEMTNSMKQLVNLSENELNILSRDNETAILNALFQYCRILEILILIERNEGREYRKYFNIRKSVKKLIERIVDHKNYERKIVWAEFLDLLPKLSTLSYSCPEEEDDDDDEEDND